MKHIQKRFLNEREIPKNFDELRKKIDSYSLDDVKNINKFPKDKVAFYTTDDNKMYQAFHVKINNEVRIIPEPDPILLYFHTAYVNYINLAETKNRLIELTEMKKGDEPAIIELYDFFGMVSSFVIFLFTTIEATMNRCIPKDYIYKRVSERKTELFTKMQMEANFSFDDKLKKILAEVTNKNFEKSFPIKYQHIINLKNFRDDIIHTKSEGQGKTPIDHNYRRAFTFDYDKTIHAVKDFCNFYINSNFIVDCNCSYSW